jgi:hypothetical protein
VLRGLVVGAAAPAVADRGAAVVTLGAVEVGVGVEADGPASAGTATTPRAHAAPRISNARARPNRVENLPLTASPSSSNRAGAQTSLFALLKWTG